MTAAEGPLHGKVLTCTLPHVRRIADMCTIPLPKKACLVTSLGFLAIREPLPGTPNMPGSGGGRIENGSAVAGRAVV